MDAAPETAWQRFRNRMVATDKRSAFLQNWAVIRSLLDLPDDQVAARLREIVASMDETAFQTFYETFVMVSSKSAQRAGLVVVTDPAEFSRLWDAYFSGGDPEAALFGRLLAVRQQLDAVRKPLLQQPFNAEEQKLFATASALGDRLTVATRAAAPGAASADGLSALEALIAQYRSFLAATPLENRNRRMLLDGLEAALESAGRCAFLLNRFDSAKRWYEQAAQQCAQRGEVSNAERCRERANDIDLATRGDVDEALRRNFAGLLGDEAQGSKGSLDRAKAVVGVLQQTLAGGDIFGATNILPQAVGVLRQLGYADPFDAGLEPAVEGWVQAVPAALDGTAFMSTLAVVAGLFATITGARSQIAAGSDPATEARANGVLRELLTLPARMFAEATAAETDLDRRWAAMSDRPLAPDPAFIAGLAALDAASAAAQQRIVALAATIADLNAEKDRRQALGEPLDALLDRAQQAEVEAGALKQPAYAASASLLHADLLLGLNRPKDALDVLVLARAAWNTAFDPPAKDESAQERTTDVQFLRRMVEAHAQLGDTPAIFALCGEAIEKIEQDRYKVSSPYLQSAFLKDRAELYMLGVFSAYKLGDFATMQERSELSKARSALRLRYIPEPGELEVVDLGQRFRDVCRQIDAAPTPDLVSQRQQLWDLLAIARMRSAGDGVTAVPEFSLSALKAGIASDEAVLSYYWLQPTVLLITAIDATRTIVERVIWEDADRACFDELIAFLGSMTSNNDNLDAALQQFASSLLPTPIAAFIDGRRRLILSPHRALHLFPFHALPWKNGRLIEAFAIAYAPNLSVLLVPTVRTEARRVLLMGVGDFSAVESASLIPLPGVYYEMIGSAEAYRKTGITYEAVMDDGVTRQALQRRSDSGELQRFTHIVLATHGTSAFSGDAASAPMESRMYLHDAALDGLEISQLRIGAELVILSACCSGQRALGGRGMQELPGDDLFGLQAAFNMAGAQAVLACLWPAHDAVAPKVMGSLHARLADGAPADLALQGALVDHLRAGTHAEPFYWAPFFVSVMAGRMHAPKGEP